MTKTKQRKSTFLKMVGAMVMAMMLVFSMGVSAMANWDTQSETLEFGESDTPEAVIAKVLQMPINTTTPAVTFVFEFRPIDVDDVLYDNTNMPTITDATIAFTASDAGDVDAGVKTVIKESANFANITFPVSGVYTYEVTEKLNVYTTPTGAAYTDIMTYSQAVYEIKFLVLQGNDGLYIAQIATYLIKDQDGGTTGGEKVDPTPGTNYYGGDYSQLFFLNTYIKTENGGSDDPDDQDPDTLNILRVEKLTTGNGGDPNKYFAFTVTVTAPTVGAALGTYKAYIYDEDGSVAIGPTEGANGVARDHLDALGDYINFSSGTARTVNLKSGQYLLFSDLEVGSEVLVSEAAEAGYIANYVLTLGGVAAATSTNTTAATAMATPTTGSGTGYTIPYLGEGANKALFTNDRTIEPLTGIAVADLPYYVLAALLLLAAAGYVTFKVRRNAKYSAR